MGVPDKIEDCIIKSDTLEEMETVWNWFKGKGYKANYYSFKYKQVMPLGVFFDRIAASAINPNCSAKEFLAKFGHGVNTASADTLEPKDYLSKEKMKEVGVDIDASGIRTIDPVQAVKDSADEFKEIIKLLQDEGESRPSQNIISNPGGDNQTTIKEKTMKEKLQTKATEIYNKIKPYENYILILVVLYLIDYYLLKGKYSEKLTNIVGRFCDKLVVIIDKGLNKLGGGLNENT